MNEYDTLRGEERKQAENQLIAAIKDNVDKIDEMIKSQEHDLEYFLYRFYHVSFKVYSSQKETEKMVDFFKSLLPDRPLNPLFLDLVEKGTDIEWEVGHNQDWSNHPKAILEAFMHAKAILQCMKKYSSKEIPADWLPEGWGVVLYLYQIR